MDLGEGSRGERRRGEGLGVTEVRELLSGGGKDENLVVPFHSLSPPPHTVPF